MAVQQMSTAASPESDLERLASTDSHEQADVEHEPIERISFGHLDLADARADIAILGAKIREEAKVLASELSMDMVPALVASLSPKRRPIDPMAESEFQDRVSISNAELLNEVYRLAGLSDTVVTTGSSVRNELRRVAAQLKEDTRQQTMHDIAQYSAAESSTTESLPKSPAGSFFAAPGGASMNHFERRFAEWKQHSPSSPPLSPAAASVSTPKLLPRAQGTSASNARSATSTLQHVPAFEEVFISRSPVRKMATDPKQFEADMRDAALASSQHRSPGTRPALPPSYTLRDQQPQMTDAASFLHEAVSTGSSSSNKDFNATANAPLLQSPVKQPSRAVLRSAVFDFALPQRLSEITPLPAPDAQLRPQSPVYVAVPEPAPQLCVVEEDAPITDGSLTSPLGSMNPAPRLAAPHAALKPTPSKSVPRPSTPNSSEHAPVAMRIVPSSPLVDAVAKGAELPNYSMRMHLESILAPLHSQLATSSAAADLRVGSPQLLRRSHIR
jgi:hypothetical protein